MTSGAVGKVIVMNPDEHRDFIVRTMSADDVALAVEWAAAEGWNPGLHDAECFRAGDPDGFFIGEWRGEPVACISAIAYGEHFGFIGLYIVKPAFRGKGFGMRVWQHGMDYLGKRNVGLDGVVAQQANLQKVWLSACVSQHSLSGCRSGIGRKRDGFERPFEHLECVGAPVRDDCLTTITSAFPPCVSIFSRHGSASVTPRL